MTTEEILLDMWKLLKKMQMPNFSKEDWEPYDRLLAYFEPDKKKEPK